MDLLWLAVILAGASIVLISTLALCKASGKADKRIDDIRSEK